MGIENDYYRILGVLDDAEDIVIRAAYRALAQRYHPDKWQGDQAEATRRMAEINVAYAVLSDTVKRATYDSTRDKNQFRDEPPDAEDANESINKDWELAIKYLPDLKRIENDLHAISRELAFTFRLMLLESKRFDESGDYIRKYVPELAHLSAAEIHEPWLYLDGYSKGYAERIVDHAVERLESLARLQEIKEDKPELPR